MADESPTTAVAQLTTELETLRSESTRQSIQAEEALHELAGKLATAEQLLEQERLEKVNATAGEERERRKVLVLQHEVEEGKRAIAGRSQEEKERGKKAEQLEREKRELLEVYERTEGDKRQLEGELS